MQSSSFRSLLAAGAVLLSGPTGAAPDPSVTTTGRPAGIMHGHARLDMMPVPGRRTIGKVEFLDDDGRVARTITRDWEKIPVIYPSGTCYIATLSNLAQGFYFSYLDDRGKLLWSTTICCDSVGPENIVVPSEDGSVIALWDADSGANCSEGMGGGYVNPEGCFGLRVYSRMGRLLFTGTRYSIRPKVSPSGKYVVWDAADKAWYLLHVSSGGTEKIPNPGYGRPLEVSDSGVVSFIYAPGKPEMIFVPGRGLCSTMYK